MKYETIIGLTLFGIGSSIIIGMVTDRPSYIISPVSAINYENTKPAVPITVSASWYGQEYCNKYNPTCIAADGSRFIDENYTAACDRRWKLGTYLKVSYKGRSLVVKCTDRGSFQKYGRSLDLSKGSFRYLESLSKGVIKVQVEESIY